MKLIVNEKPSQARNFAKALGGSSGTFDGEEYEIAALVGHVLELKQPSDQVPPELAEKYRKWSLEALPWSYDDIAFEKDVRGDVEDVIERLREAVGRADEVVIATDVDPSGEGELLAWEALDFVGWDGPTWRMYFVDEAPNSIRKAFKEMKRLDGMEEDGDYAKAECRNRWDFMSMQFTRIATCVAASRGFRTVVRQGRLKSVMVHLVGQQLDAVANYKKVPYYEARYADEHGNVFKRAETDAERFDAPDKVGIGKFARCAVAVDSREMKRKAPGKLLDLMGMASILATKGHDSKRVLEVYQKMYEDQVVSYPRTEDKTITPEQFDELAPLVDEIAGVVGVEAALLTHRAPRKTHVKEGGAHGANRPGPNVPESLDALGKYGKEAPAIYELLARNYLAMLAEDYEYEQVKAHLVERPDFTGSVNLPVKPGFHAVFDSESEGKDKEEEEGAAADGGKKQPHDFGETADPFVYEGCNKKPQRPTMKWLKARLEKYNVGTGATRVSTLDDIKGRDKKALLTEKKGVLGLTECGKVSYKLLNGCAIASPEATEKLFSLMERVATFEIDAEQVVRSIDKLVEHDRAVMTANAAALGDLSGSAHETIGKCPLCGAPVWKKTKSAACSSNKYEKDEDGNWQRTAGCGFKMFATFMGKKLTSKQMEKLLAGGKVTVKGLTSKKTGNKYDAYAKLSDTPNENGWYAAEMAGFPDKPKKGGKGGKRKA